MCTSLFQFIFRFIFKARFILDTGSVVPVFTWFTRDPIDHWICKGTDDVTFGSTFLVFISVILIISCWFSPAKHVIGGWLFGFALLSRRSCTFAGFLWLWSGLLRYTSFSFGVLFFFLVSIERSQTCIGFPTYSTFMCGFNIGFFLVIVKQAQMPSFFSL